MTINMNYWFIVTKAEVEAGGAGTYCEVSDEQFKRIEASYKTGKFEYMTDDKDLSDVVELVYQDAVDDGNDYYGEAMKELTIVFEYPDEIKVA